MILSKRSEQFVEKIENGILNEKYQTSECSFLLEGNLNNSVRQFDKYIVSCGHCLQKHRIENAFVFYYG